MILLLLMLIMMIIITPLFNIKVFKISKNMTLRIKIMLEPIILQTKNAKIIIYVFTIVITFDVTFTTFRPL